MTADEMMSSLRPRAVKAMTTLHPLLGTFDEYARIVSAVHAAEAAQHRAWEALRKADDFLAAL